MTDTPQHPAEKFLASSVSAVTFLLTAFGAALLELAPPSDANPQLSVGMASFLALGVLLYVRAMSPTRRTARRWAAVGAGAMVLSFPAWMGYGEVYQRNTIGYPEPDSPERYVAGAVAELTPAAKEIMATPGMTVHAVLAQFGLPNKALVWPDASLRKAQRWLNGSYALLVVLVATGVFCLTEAAMITYKRG